MNRDLIDWIVVVVQVLTLIFLIIYVVKTWEMADATKQSTQISTAVLEEMRQTRTDESAPYVVVYFDIPYGSWIVYLIIKNIGKTVAENVKIEFQPDLESGHSDDKISQTPLMKNGIGSMAPGYELRTLIDSTVGYFGKEPPLPRSYQVTVTYSGGSPSVRRSLTQMLDLSIYEGLHFTDVKDVGDVVKELENLVKQTEKVAQHMKSLDDHLESGVWIKNPYFMTSSAEPQSEVWRRSILGKLNELRFLWSSVNVDSHDTLDSNIIGALMHKCAALADQIIVILGHGDQNNSVGLVEPVTALVQKLTAFTQEPIMRYMGRAEEDLQTLSSYKVELLQQVSDIVGLLLQPQQSEQLAGDDETAAAENNEE